MSLLDRSPGGLIAVAFGVLYGTVLVEIAMLLLGSYAAMAATLVTILVIAGLLAVWMHGLLDTGHDAIPAPSAGAVQPADGRHVDSPAGELRRGAVDRREPGRGARRHEPRDGRGPRPGAAVVGR